MGMRLRQLAPALVAASAIAVGGTSTALARSVDEPQAGASASCTATTAPEVPSGYVPVQPGEEDATVTLGEYGPPPRKGDARAARRKTVITVTTIKINQRWPKPDIVIVVITISDGAERTSPDPQVCSQDRSHPPAKLKLLRKSKREARIEEFRRIGDDTAPRIIRACYSRRGGRRCVYAKVP